MLHRLSRIEGFHVHATDGDIGHVDDFLIDVATWQVRHLVVDTSNWLGGKWVAVPVSAVTRVEWSDHEVYVDLTREQIKDSPSMLEADVPSHELAPPFVII